MRMNQTLLATLTLLLLAGSVPLSEDRYGRRYPTGKLFGQPVGFDDVKFGRGGLEKYYNDQLTGATNEFAARNPAPTMTAAAKPPSTDNARGISGPAAFSTGESCGAAGRGRRAPVPRWGLTATSAPPDTDARPSPSPAGTPPRSARPRPAGRRVVATRPLGRWDQAATRSRVGHPCPFLRRGVHRPLLRGWQRGPAYGGYSANTSRRRR